MTLGASVLEIHSVSDLAASIREERRRQHIRQQDLADLANVSCRFLSDLENAKPSVELSKVLAVLAALGLDLQILPRGQKGTPHA